MKRLKESIKSSIKIGVSEAPVLPENRMCDGLKKILDTIYMKPLFKCSKHFRMTYPLNYYFVLQVKE